MLIRAPLCDADKDRFCLAISFSFDNCHQIEVLVLADYPAITGTSLIVSCCCCCRSTESRWANQHHREILQRNPTALSYHRIIVWSYNLKDLSCYLKDNHLFSSSLQLPSFAVFTYTIKPSGAICFCGVTVNIGRPSMSNLSLSHFLLKHYHSFLTIELLIRFSCLQKAPHRG